MIVLLKILGKIHINIIKKYYDHKANKKFAFYRDQIIVSSISKRLDKNAGELMRRLLFLMYLRTASWEDTSNPIPFAEIKDAVKKLNYPLLTQHLDQYLRLIGMDNRCT